MKRPEDEVVAKLVAGWVDKAEQDLAAARTLLGAEIPLLFPACFHAQQAIEKFIKAYLTRRQVEFPKTHSIRELVDLVSCHDEDLGVRLEPAIDLTPFGVEGRYPGDWPEPSEDEATDAVSLVERLAEILRGELGAEDSP